jgi:hypothetical protein
MTNLSSYKMSFEKSEGTGSLRKPRLRWDDNIKVDFKEVRCEGVE